MTLLSLFKRKRVEVYRPPFVTVLNYNTKYHGNAGFVLIMKHSGITGHMSFMRTVYVN